MPAHGKICLITNCTTRVYHHGNVCANHRYRLKKYNSYDLPGHEGPPSRLELPVLPDGIVKNCKIHGHLPLEDCYIKMYKNTPHYKCKQCILSLNIKNKYQGMKSLECYNKMLAAQSGVCKMCKGNNTVTRNGKIKRFAIDHDHQTGKVRGLLCGFCNALIGYAKDDISILKSAIKYLTKKG